MSHDLRNDPAAHAFTSVAARFCMLLEHPVKDREAWLADVLISLAALYAAAPVLLQMDIPAEEKDIPDDFKLGNDEWNTLYHHLKAVLGKDAAYSAYFNPTAGAQEPIVGDLADDLADIYRDIRPGLTAWNTGDDGYLHHVLYDWLEIGYRHHWGRHAVDALRALHWLVNQ